MARPYPKAWFYQDESEHNPHARLHYQIMGKPTATAFEIALELHLREMERRHGHCINTRKLSCSECRRQVKTQIERAMTDGLGEERCRDEGTNDGTTAQEGTRKAPDSEAKAIHHVLAVHSRTFHMGMDSGTFDDRHDR